MSMKAKDKVFLTNDDRTHYEVVEYVEAYNKTYTTDTFDENYNCYTSDLIDSTDYDMKNELGRVVFDGAAYDDVMFDNNKRAGDQSLVDLPFYLWCNPDPEASVMKLYAATPGEHTVEIYRKIVTVKKLEDKYLPDSASKNFIVTATYDNSLMGPIVDHTAEEICAAAEEGYNVILKYEYSGDHYFPLTRADNGSMAYFTGMTASHDKGILYDYVTVYSFFVIGSEVQLKTGTISLTM